MIYSKKDMLYILYPLLKIINTWDGRAYYSSIIMHCILLSNHRKLPHNDI